MSTRQAFTLDSPSTFCPWEEGNPDGTSQHLVGTGGEDRFRTWLAVKRRNAAEVIALNYADWTVKHRTDIEFDSGRPSRSRVVPYRSSGIAILRHGDGFGSGRRPVLGGGVANDLKQRVESTWRFLR